MGLGVGLCSMWECRYLSLGLDLDIGLGKI